MSQKITSKILILDLDECLCRSLTEADGKAKQLEILQSENVAFRQRFFSTTINNNGRRLTFWGVKRPGLDQFLNFCERYFEHIIVWSAGSYDYVHAITDLLFQDHIKPELVLTWDDCVRVDPDNDREYHKPISIVSKKLKYVTLKDTFFMDNKEDNCRDNADNGIIIPDFDPKEDDALTRTDHCLDQVIEWLMHPEVIASKDVRKLDKRGIFKTNITTKHNHLKMYINRYVFAPTLNV